MSLYFAIQVKKNKLDLCLQDIIEKTAFDEFDEGCLLYTKDKMTSKLQFSSIKFINNNINLIKDNESWQAGFAETLIYQVDLDSGYSGNPLEMNMWSNVTFNNVPIRNLCPVKYADEIRSDKMFLLSKLRKNYK